MHCITDSGSLDALSQTHSSLLISEWHLLENVLHADPTPSFFSFHILIYFIFNLCGCTFVGYATNWMPISPQNPCQNLIPNVTVLRDGVFGKWLGHIGGTLNFEISSLIPENQLVLSACEDTMKSRWSAAWKGNFSRTSSCWSLILAFHPSEL